MRVSFKRGNKLTLEEIEECLELLKEGGAVQFFKTAKTGLMSALAVITLREKGILVGLGAIKDCRPEYTVKISDRSEFTLEKDMQELGYIVVKESYRGQGLSKYIVSQLVEMLPCPSLFAVTSNPAMIRTFVRQGFHSVGYLWKSKEGDRLSLWVKN